MHINHKHAALLTSGICAAITACPNPAHAVDFDLGSGWTGSWQNSVSLGTAWRARNADPELYSQANGLLVGKTGGRAPNTTDEGNLNYDKGDRFTTLFKWITELNVQKNDTGALIRAKAWYDYTLNKEDVRYGNQNNGYNGFDGTSLTNRRPLSDSGFEPLSRFDGIYLLDAYVYHTFDVAGKPLQLRAGNQVVNWGESLFIQGINQINPIDVPSFHKPGAQLKEVLLPVPIVHANQSLGAFGSLELFYQARWKRTPIDMGCGNYWSIVGANIGNHVGSCDNIISLVPGGSQPLGTMLNAYVGVVDSKKPSNTGQFGLAYRFYSEDLDTEFGLYGMRYHSRTPIVSLRNVGNGLAKNGMPIDATWEYPEAIRAFGISASTNLLGWSVAGEASQRRGMPVQIDGNDVLYAGLGAAGAIVPGASIPFGPYGNGAVAAAGINGGDGYLRGYTRANVSQLQLNAVKAGNGLLGGDRYLFVAEAGFQWNNLDDDRLRYNRAFIFGPGSDQGYGGSTCGTLNTTRAGCADDGYVSKFAWGYRLKLDVTYNDVLAGVAVTPSVFWSHDVKGYAADGQFNEDRQALGLNLKFKYRNTYSLEFGATMFNRDANYDPARDRGFYYVTAAIDI
ncbi:MAG: DUF1302 domain-containing protein [Novosphingobium sp.]|nr:DUF1302 domain-containing protein [Novosphingobium sp.]